MLNLMFFLKKTALYCSIKTAVNGSFCYIIAGYQLGKYYILVIKKQNTAL